MNKVFSYQGTSVTFIHKDGKVMVNATEMAKPFGDSKRAKNWLILNATNEFLNILSKGRNLPLADLVRVTMPDYKACRSAMSMVGYTRDTWPKDDENKPSFSCAIDKETNTITITCDRSH